VGASLVLLGSLLGFWLGISSQPVEFNKTALMALFAGVASLGGYLWKQFNKFKNLTSDEISISCRPEAFFK
jgi:hypothetical protein